MLQVVSRDIRRVLTQRANAFNIVLDDVSITQLTFGREYTHAIEAKQVAQQEAERAKFIVSFDQFRISALCIPARMHTFQISIKFQHPWTCSYCL